MKNEGTNPVMVVEHSKRWPCFPWLAFGFLLLGDVTAASSPSPPVLERVEPWSVDYADGSCSLLSTFGTGADRIILRVIQFGPGPVQTLTLYGKRFEDLAAANIAVQVHFGPEIAAAQTKAMVGSHRSRSGKVAMVSMPAGYIGNQIGLSSYGDLKSESSGNTSNQDLLFELRGLAPFALRIGSMEKPAQAMKACVDDLLQSWGFEPGELATRQSRAAPIGNSGNWISASDYPLTMVAYGQSAQVSVRLLIDARGKISSCTILAATTPKEVGPYTCRLLNSRARFTPARDRNGVAVSDFWLSNTVWRIED